MKLTSFVLIIVAAALLPHSANAQTFLVDTGIPNGAQGALALSSVQPLAAEFDVQAGQTVTSLSAYINQGTGQPGDFLTFDIYQTLPGRNSEPVFATATAQWTQNGWTTATLNWTPTTSGDYWMTIGTTNSDTFSLPTLATNTTGNPPAAAFEYKNGLGYTDSGALPFGVEIEAVPEPSSWMLALGCIGAFTFLRRRMAAAI